MFAVAVFTQRRTRAGTQISRLVGLGSCSLADSMIIIAASTAPSLLGPTRDLRRPPQQIYLLLVVGREHLDQQLVRWIAGQCVASLQNRFIDRPEARL